MAKKSRKPATRSRRPARSKKKAPARKAAGQADRRRRTPETLRLRSLAPSFTVNDVEQSIRFYTGVLGFVEDERWKDAAGALRGASLKAGVCTVNLTQDDWAKGRDRKKGVGLRVWCGTAQDIDALAKRITSAGGRLSEGPTTQSWGARSLGIEDPDGFQITIYREK
jgi:catechol 2,3-dioxygenase-like lactoylglutathione lyase family enzyme